MEFQKTSQKYTPLLILILLLIIILECGDPAHAAAGSSITNGGRWELLLNSTGIVGMHMALTHHNTVIMFDQKGSGLSGYRLRHRFSGKKCNSSEDPLCYAHSVEYNISANKIRPLSLETDPWCSSGSFLSNGTLLQTGGNNAGARRVRYFSPCHGGQGHWRESRTLLSENRWYASSQILPENDQVIIVGGRRVHTFEFFPSSSHKSFDLHLLHDTNTERRNFYPILHLSSDGNLFIMAGRDSILFNYRTHHVVKRFPPISDGARTYPSTGSSVILPLEHEDGFQKVEVMVCGGAASGGVEAAHRGMFLGGLSSCGRMVITGNRHKWNMENMPGPRLLNDMVILPTGHVLIINGAKSGSAGFNNAKNASLQPYLYNPKKVLGKRFSIMESTKIARMYHSSAILLPDGRVLVAGGNPNNRYIFGDVAYPTELRLQAYVPHYMERQFHSQRPGNVSIQYAERGDYGVRYGKGFQVRFWLERRPSNVEFSAYAPSFATHSISMNQRMLRLRSRNMNRTGGGWVSAVLEAPPSPNVAPSGYYLLTVINGGIPSTSQWVRFLHT